MDDRKITTGDVKLVIGMATIIVTIVLAWASLANMAKTAIDEASKANTATERLNEAQGNMALDIREIKTALKIKGIISREGPPDITESPIAGESAQLTPIPSQAVVINEIMTPITPTNTPTPTPTPTPSSQNPVFCVIGICLGKT